MKRQPTVYVMVGLPRSGKSTWVERFGFGMPIVSADKLRYIVYGKRFDGEREPEMWALREVLLKTMFEQGLDFIIDEANTMRKRRDPIVAMAKNYSYRVFAVVVDTSKEVCIERANATNDIIILPSIERMANQFEPISKDEGFDAVLNANTFSSNIDKNQIQKIRELVESTTPGRWYAKNIPYDGYQVPYIISDGGEGAMYIAQTAYDTQYDEDLYPIKRDYLHNIDKDTLFIANAKEDILYLLEIIKDRLNI